VASVYLSDRDSVFASDEAHDLSGGCRPWPSRRTPACCAPAGHPPIGLGLDELAALADDDGLRARSAQLRALHAIWRSQGVLPCCARPCTSSTCPRAGCAITAASGA
jgi:exodeoxyribonuclease V beta subunit